MRGTAVGRTTCNFAGLAYGRAVHTPGACAETHGSAPQPRQESPVPRQPLLGHVAEIRRQILKLRANARGGPSPTSTMSKSEWRAPTVRPPP